MLNMAFIAPGNVCVCLCACFLHKMNTVLSCVKLAYQINCMPMQINPQANKHSQLIPRQYVGKQRQRQRAVETGRFCEETEDERISVCVGKSGRGEISFSTNVYV